MLIYGSKKKIIAQKITIERRCPICFRTEQIASGAYESIHLYWIPAWVINKAITLKCCNCGHVTLVSNYRKNVDYGKCKKLFSLSHLWTNYALWWIVAILIMITKTLQYFNG